MRRQRPTRSSWGPKPPREGQGRETPSFSRGDTPLGRPRGTLCSRAGEGRPCGAHLFCLCSNQARRARRGRAWRPLRRAGERSEAREVHCCPTGGICARLRGAHGVRGRTTAPFWGLARGSHWGASCGGEAPGATDGARPRPGGATGRPPSASRGAESGHAAHYMLSLCAGATGGGKGPQMAFLAAGPAAHGAAALAPRARHRAMTRARVGPAEPGPKARGQLQPLVQRPCTHGAHAMAG